MKVAIAGKGGVGKTFIAGCLAHSLAKKGWRTVAIDADPSPNLAMTLGLTSDEALRITPLCENKDLVQKKTASGYSGVFRLNFSMEDVIESYSVRTPAGVYLLVMGTVRSMGIGCTCPANTLVRNLLKTLLIRKDQAVVMDMEAGVEHLGRGTSEHVDIMCIVSDASMKSLETARNIHRIASSGGIKWIYLIGNRICDDEEREQIKKYANRYALPLLALIPYDPIIAEADIKGTSPIFIQDSVAIRAVEELAGLVSGRSA